MTTLKVMVIRDGNGLSPLAGVAVLIPLPPSKRRPKPASSNSTHFERMTLVRATERSMQRRLARPVAGSVHCYSTRSCLPGSTKLVYRQRKFSISTKIDIRRAFSFHGHDGPIAAACRSFRICATIVAVWLPSLLKRNDKVLKGQPLQQLLQMRSRS